MKIPATESRRAIKAIHLAIEKSQLGQRIKKRFVFVGGGLVPLLLTDKAAAPARPTKDVDVVLEVASQGEYSYLRQDLLNAGFHDDVLMDKPKCALFYGEWRVDFLCASPEVMGMGNRWFPQVIEDAVLVLVEDTQVWRASTPTWIATKLEAWLNRGRNAMGGADYYAQDMEDIIAVFDGRPECVEEVSRAPNSVMAFLREILGLALSSPDFLSALPGHTSGHERAQIVLARIRAALAL